MHPSTLLEQEAEGNQDLQHQLWRMTLHNKLSLAPFKGEPQHVLDLATGTGIWAVEFALEHPTTTVIGNDLSPIQPELYVSYIP
jgi:ubiquinone/menaquinone biosynthesis C-methylase UbiE